MFGVVEASAGTGVANGTRTGGTRQARLARGWRGEICDRFAIGDGVGRAGCPGVFADFDARLNFGVASRSGGASLAFRARVGGGLCDVRPWDRLVPAVLLIASELSIG
jgi:hypothetical protein